VKTGKKLAFNGSNSYDAEDAPSELTYAWDFDGNGTVDATGQSATYAYSAAGVYKAVLKVTDTAKATGSDTVSVVVSAK
jgi:PKD repeat protein